MASTQVTRPTLVVRDSGTIRDAGLRTIRYGLIQRGVANPNVTPASDWYILWQSIGNQLAITEANGAIRADQVLPDSATGNDLLRQCAIYNVQADAASGSVGPVTFATSQATTVNQFAKLIDGAGLVFQVTSSTGTFNNGDTIQVQAVDVGSQTNHDAGDILRWVSSPAGANEKVTVGIGGLVDGTDADNEETLRARLLDKLSNPPASGNAQDVIELAEASTAAVQKAFAAPAVRGPGTYGVSVAAAPTATNKTREVNSTIVTSTITPYITGAYPEHADAVITSVVDVPADVSFGLVLPSSPTATPPGPGGGWLNGSPWPAPDASSTWNCTVTSVTSSTHFVVDATTAPIAGITRIQSLSPVDWNLYSALVTTVTGSSGAYTITIDNPWPNVATGNYIFPACANAQAYVNTVLSVFSLMGPGDMTANTSALKRAFRRPTPSQSWPMTLGGHLTLGLSNSQSEVQSAQFFYRTDGTTTLTGSGGLVTPQIPALPSTGPNIYIPRNIGFYRVP